MVPIRMELSFDKSENCWVLKPAFKYLELHIYVEVHIHKVLIAGVDSPTSYRIFKTDNKGSSRTQLIPDTTLAKMLTRHEFEEPHSFVSTLAGSGHSKELIIATQMIAQLEAMLTLGLFSLAITD